MKDKIQRQLTSTESAEIRRWRQTIRQMAIKGARGFAWIAAEDLEQEGKKALILAMRSYDNDVEAQTIPWGSYANKRIRRGMLRFIEKERKEFLGA